jgi:Leucine-rich repeat (LRR) protein
VSNNSLVAIPVTIGFCKLLSAFDFSANSVSQIPESLGLCTNLASLKLAGNMVKNIPPHVGLLTNLTVLDISRNPMERVVTALFDLCGMSLGLTFLRQVYYAMKNLNRGDDELQPDADDALHEDVALQVLLEGGGRNEMDVSGFKLQAWPPHLSPASSVCVLHRIGHVHSLNLSNNELCEVPEQVSCLANLKVLSLSRNKIVSITTSMSALTQLNILDLSFNKLTQVSSMSSCCKFTLNTLKSNSLNRPPNTSFNRPPNTSFNMPLDTHFPLADKQRHFGCDDFDQPELARKSHFPSSCCAAAVALLFVHPRSQSQHRNTNPASG